MPATLTAHDTTAIPRDIMRTVCTALLVRAMTEMPEGPSHGADILTRIADAVDRCAKGYMHPVDAADLVRALAPTYLPMEKSSLAVASRVCIAVSSILDETI